MRRKDREMPPEFAFAVIDNCLYANLATTNVDGTPYCVPLSVVRDGNSVCFHCARDGKKTEIMRVNPGVCMTFADNVNIPEGRFSTEYDSAIIFGKAEEIADSAEKVRLLKLLCEKYTPGNMDSFNSEISQALGRTAVWRVEITSITGKRCKYD